MADISVTLELDDSKYAGKLKQAETNAKSFTSAVDKGLKENQSSFDSFGRGVQGINSKLEGMTRILVGIGIIEFTRSLLESANQLKDMAGALDVTIAGIMGMGAAAAQSGSGLEGVSKMLFKMENAAGQAADGSAKMIDTFASVGVSMTDLQKMGPEEVFNRVAKALGEIPNQATRARIATELFGRGAHTFDFKEYSEKIKQTSVAFLEFEESQKKAADISERMKLQVLLVTTQFTQLLTPILDLLKPTDDMGAAMDRARVVAYALAVAMAGFVSVQVINGITSIAGAIKVLAGMFYASAGAAAVSTAAIAVDTGATLLNANAKTFLAAAHGRVGTAVTAVAVAEAELAAAMLTGTATTAQIATLTAALATARSALAIRTQALAVTEAELALMTRATTVATGTLATATTTATVATTGMTVATTGLAARLLPLLGIATSVAAVFGLLYSSNLNEGEDEQLKRMREAGRLTDALGTLSEAQKKAYDALSAADKARINEMIVNSTNAKKAQELMDRVMGKPASASGGGTISVKGNIDPAAGSKARVLAIQFETENLDRQNKRLLERIDLEATLTSSSKADRDSRLAGFDQETKFLQEQFRIKQELTKLEGEAKQDPQAGTKGVYQVIEALKKQLAGLKDISKQIEENKKKEIETANAVEMTTYFIEQQQKAKQGVLDIEYQIADLTKTSSQIQLSTIDRQIQKEGDLAIAKRRAQLGANGVVSDDEQAKIRAEIEKTYALTKKRNSELIEESRKFSTGWDKAWNDYVDNATNASKTATNLFSKSMSGMEDLLVNFAKTGKFTWRSFVNMMLEELMRAQIQSTFASILGGMKGAMGGGAGGIGSLIGGLFGGGSKAAPAAGGGGGFFSGIMDLGKSAIGGIGKLFGFAGGGSVNGTSPILIGERGPEIFNPSSSGTIIPNDKLGGSTNVTYNINAVDAQSFRAMIARDPQFLFAVTEQGRKSIPGAR